ncbi:2-keto-4-pentenoate hydratase/2-oxohepta-3-ene-1,7-dioic acid hydratase in catechol pathway [Lysinibacter cavernae]|uniref:2-keto-4-pentenoate hydratase/2-oxohepta-3-ene-1,7-dioic acid hydratase in catechol pathway n=1 Tax=Lysinibacter cavernae TaxID=1640652 RepID=A0A7X5TUG8_9MICO|nr:fumarylacetoacetate hydrolase family protein [Lysinibacter cavernae]NIH53572.1 2-keto-4-pentenoate hydratase/2-oxohepta-3-ene-1,7-dioic acid hydratase in catechol pathway [Lysinibacter cavernae]
MAVVVNDEAAFVDDLIADAPRDLQELISRGPEVRKALIAEIGTALEAGASTQPVADLHFGSAVQRPPIILAVGLNYSEHASELSLDNNSEPVLFALFPNSLTGHKRTVELPTRLSEEVDYEAELGVIIGTEAKNVSVEDALDYVFGYTVVNDITARNLQFQEPQWCRCKSFDGFTPTGPVVVTSDEIPDPQQTWIRTVVNGVTVQDSSASNMIRSVAQLVSSLSQETTLKPGTLISTGSPGGAGRSRKPPLYLGDGTVVTVSVDAIGELTSHCVAI